jgi:hypothetical protein
VVLFPYRRSWITGSELIQQRLNWYHQWLHSLCSHLQKEIPIPQDIFSLLLLQAVELTAADMLSDAIALAPVLYDRDSRIIESDQLLFLAPGIYDAGP